MKNIIFFLFTLVCSSFTFAQNPADYVRALGTELVVGSANTPIHLRGFNFWHAYSWEECTFQDLTDIYYHEEFDFLNVRKLGFNSVRLDLTASILENRLEPYLYREEGFRWLEHHIDWAKKHGVYVILNIHYPPGADYCHNDQPADFWGNPESKKRAIALWMEVARRYKDNTTIAAYDLVNEPTPHAPNEWENLAQEMIDSIRTIDTNHMYVIEMNYASGGLFLVNDSNVMYDVHFYHPLHFTNQNAPWTDYVEGGVYPDPNFIEFPRDLEWAESTWGNPTLPTGNTDWAYYQGNPFLAYDPEFTVGEMTLVLEGAADSVFFDQIEVREYDENEDFVRVVQQVDFNSNTKLLTGGWHHWPYDVNRFFLTDDDGRPNEHSLAITNTTAMDWSKWFSEWLRFPLKANHFYQINGYMKGVGVQSGTFCEMRVDFHRSQSNRIPMPRGIDNLKSELLRLYMDFQIQHQVPINVGEFGCVVYRPFDSGYGGVKWVSDIMDLMDIHNLNYQYSGYYGGGYGLYSGEEDLTHIAALNQELYEFFMNRGNTTTQFSQAPVFRENLLESKAVEAVPFACAPNPSHDFIRLQASLDFLKSVQKIEIFNQQGQLCKEFQVAQNLNISSLQTGIYTLLVQTDAEVFVQKFMKI